MPRPTPALSATHCAPTSHLPQPVHCSRRHNMSDSNSQPPDTKMEVTDDLDQSVENEIDHDATQADAMNLDGANDDAPTANGVPDAAAAFEQRIPAKKDATLREFLGKMDEYAPIVSALLTCWRVCLTQGSDPRCSHQLLSDTRWSPSSTSDIAAPCPPPSSCDPKVHCRHRSRCIPVLAHSFLQHHKQQPHGRSWRRSRSTRYSSSSARRERQRTQGQGLQPRHPEARIWRWWSGWQPGTDSAHHGGSRYGCWRVRCQHQARRVLPVSLRTCAHTAGALHPLLGALFLKSREHALSALVGLTGVWELESTSKKHSRSLAGCVFVQVTVHPDKHK
jgi:hypothetical protein